MPMCRHVALVARENMVKIDPDEIKGRMPEYQEYDKKMAATHCHRESDAQNHQPLQPMSTVCGN